MTVGSYIWVLIAWGLLVAFEVATWGNVLRGKCTPCGRSLRIQQ